MTLAEFDGIKIECYSGDHLPPHIHAKYGEYMDRIIIETGESMPNGNLPLKRKRKASEYVLQNKRLLKIIFFLMNQNLRKNEIK